MIDSIPGSHVVGTYGTPDASHGLIFALSYTKPWFAKWAVQFVGVDAYYLPDINMVVRLGEEPLGRRAPLSALAEDMPTKNYVAVFPINYPFDALDCSATLETRNYHACRLQSP